MAIRWLYDGYTMAIYYGYILWPYYGYTMAIWPCLPSARLGQLLGAALRIELKARHGAVRLHHAGRHLPAAPLYR